MVIYMAISTNRRVIGVSDRSRSSRISALKDGPDNRVLECAVSGRADVIVTGDKEMLRLHGYQETKIVSLKAYLASE
jgi:predicted nucleic acid-binding protein